MNDQERLTPVKMLDKGAIAMSNIVLLCIFAPVMGMAFVGTSVQDSQAHAKSAAWEESDGGGGGGGHGGGH